MKTFTLILQDATHTQCIEQVTSFVGEDASGSFGILAGHMRMMTSLVFGLARFRVGEDTWQYLALPGAVIYFNDNELSLSTRRYLVDEDYERISIALHEKLLVEENELRELKKSLHHMEEEILKRLWEMGHESELAG
ncbi:F0F1 ATP synthase subunit epsilon [Gammaproteobacteria bacterium]|nr:F0F1 ATP synthase subunit epsilon [Gammaproteobacteria bacterium]